MLNTEHYSINSTPDQAYIPPEDHIVLAYALMDATKRAIHLGNNSIIERDRAEFITRVRNALNTTICTREKIAHPELATFMDELNTKGIYDLKFDEV